MPPVPQTYASIVERAASALFKVSGSQTPSWDQASATEQKLYYDRIEAILAALREVPVSGLTDRRTRITTTWGTSAIPVAQRRNDDVELLEPYANEHVGGVVRASCEDGGIGTTVLIEVIAK